ncbi:MAG TPA: AAA family ATPase [Thermotogota bacterium]|nr:AAA family ATPase [Thermotogota bacterium]
MKKLPIGIQDYKKLREDGYLYVDKTRYLYQLANEGTPYFLSRPRRFGKSLTLSTLKYLFLGEKGLFKDTWIENRWDWKAFPVIHLSMTEVDTADPQEVGRGITYRLKRIAEENGISLEEAHYKYAFTELIEKMGKRERLVLLIDEYDKPILDHLHEPEIAQKHRDLLRTFYSTIKDADPYLRFVLMTGITKFTKAGVFSSLNNLYDISYTERYATMLGYTQEELEQDFREYIEEGIKQKGQSREEYLEEIRRYYNGFSFDGRAFVYNPFSILGYFKDYWFKNYWFETGSPYFLGEYIKRHEIEIDELMEYPISESLFSAYEIEAAPPASFLTQSGYLTFKRYREKRGYDLDFPNQEVKDAFSQLLLLHRYGLEPQTNDAIRNGILNGLDKRDFGKVFEQMRRTFANIPYTLYHKREEQKGNHPERLERFYHVVLLTLFWGCGIEVKAEEMTHLGRSDLVLVYGEDVYIMELKKAPAEKALQQIREKEYGEKYRGKNLYYVGIEIDTEQRNLKGYRIEQSTPAV